MAHWDFWGWLAYAGIWVAAIILFIDGGLRMAPDVQAHHSRLKQIIHSRGWAFSPLIFVVLATLILVAKEFDFLPKSGEQIGADFNHFLQRDSSIQKSFSKRGSLVRRT